MKLIYTFVLLTLAMAANAQKRFSEGTVSYDIVINTGSDKPKAADYLDGATSTVYLKGLRSRNEMVSSLGTQSTIIDGATGNVAIVKEYGDQKYLINLTPANWKEANKRSEGVTFQYTKETKTILGYNCIKAIGTLTDGSTFTVWYTPDLVPDNKEFQFVNKSLPGLAMEYESRMGSTKVTYTVSEVKLTAVPAAKFDLPKAGFRVMTYEESKGAGK